MTTIIRVLSRGMCYLGLSVAAASGASAQTPNPAGDPCAVDNPATAASGVTVVFQHGWSDHNGGGVEPWALVQGGDIRPVDGSVILSIDTIVNVSDGSRHAISEPGVIYVEDTGACWWTADTPTTGPYSPVVFATDDLPINTDPSDAVVSEFFALETTCVNPFSEETLSQFPRLRGECDRSVLFATSDLDSDSLTEYWYRLPDPNGMAWAIAEATVQPGGLNILVKSCGYFICAIPAF